MLKRLKHFIVKDFGHNSATPFEKVNLLKDWKVYIFLLGGFCTERVCLFDTVLNHDSWGLVKCAEKLNFERTTNLSVLANNKL